MKKILFPTAYSAHSKIAFRYAQTLAKYFEASITLIHVYEKSVPVVTSLGMVSKDELKEFAFSKESRYKDQIGRLYSFAASLKSDEFADVSLDFIAVEGDTITKLIEIQQEAKFDLVVMGTRRAGLADRIFGTTTSTLIDKMTSPILLIPPDAFYMGIDKIIYGTALEFNDQETIKELLEWCQVFEAKLHLLNVHTEEDSISANKKMAYLKSTYESESLLGIMTFQTMEGDLVNAIKSSVNVASADILAIHKRKQDFWERIIEGSLTKTLTETVKIPILVYNGAS